MASNVISPGVYRRIIDLSTFVDSVPSTIAFICFLSEKGEDNVLKFVSSQEELITKNGQPNINRYGQGLYNADQFLQRSQSLYYVRVTAPDACFANVFVTLANSVDDKFTTTSHADVETVSELETILASTTGDPNFIAFYGVGRGTYYNTTAVTLTPSSSLAGLDTYVIDIWEEDLTGDMVIIESFVGSLNPDQQYNGRSIYIEDIVNTYSNILNCRVNVANMTEYLSFKAFADAGNPAGYTGPITFWYTVGPPVQYTKISDPFSAYILLAGGFDSDMYNVDGTVNWVAAEQYLAQAYLGDLPYYDPSVGDTDRTFFTVVFDADYPDGVKDSIKALCETREDCVAIMDNGFHTGPNGIQAAIDDAEGGGVHDFNSWYVALYENHTLVYDRYTGRRIWLSPSYWMSAIIPTNDRVAEPWFAAAGYNRAALSGIKEGALYPTKGDRDRFYEIQLNPIALLKPGWVVWGQQTKWDKPSALRDLNIVRLLLYIDAALKQFALFYIFEQNDYFTWSSFQDRVITFLEDIVARRGLFSYQVKVFATEYELQTNSFHADIWLKAIPTVEKIFLNYTITK